MKIALISDIHANAFYFKKILEDIRNQQVDKIVCLGDLVGYYDEPNEVIDICRTNNIECVQGNHEEYFLQTLNYNKEKENIYRIETHREILSVENKSFIEKMPKEIIFKYGDVSIYCTHALPTNTVKYLYNPNDIADKYIQGHDYYCSGHTHIPYIQYKYGICLINPGSVGQPRDYTTLPSYALIDLKEKEVLIKKINVDTNKYVSCLIEMKLCQELTDILIRKRA